MFVFGVSKIITTAILILSLSLVSVRCDQGQEWGLALNGEVGRPKTTEQSQQGWGPAWTDKLVRPDRPSHALCAGRQRGAGRPRCRHCPKSSQDWTLARGCEPCFLKVGRHHSRFAAWLRAAAGAVAALPAMTMCDVLTRCPGSREAGQHLTVASCPPRRRLMRSPFFTTSDLVLA